MRRPKPCRAPGCERDPSPDQGSEVAKEALPAAPAVDVQSQLLQLLSGSFGGLSDAEGPGTSLEASEVQLEGQGGAEAGREVEPEYEPDEYVPE